MPGLDKPPPDTGFNPQQNSENPYVSIHFSLLIIKRRNEDIQKPVQKFEVASEDLQKPVQKFEVGFEDLHLLHLILKVRNVNLHFFFLLSKVRNVSIHKKYCRAKHIYMNQFGCLARHFNAGIG